MGDVRERKIEMLTLSAPAKVNLTLEALGKRQDDFHEIRSVIQTIDLCDKLNFQPAHETSFKSDMAEWNAEESLVSRVVDLMRQTSGYSGGVAIEVEKRIPLMVGLGGDSSDAAATLRGLNQLWGLNLPLDKLLKMARQLGSDVAFFLYGGTALVEGRGEIVTPLSPLPHSWVVLMTPPVLRLPGKTKQLYGALRAAHYTDGQITERLAKELKAGREFTPSLLFNTFENVAFAHFSELSVYRERMLKVGASDVYLAGSGPALFALLKDKTRAEELYLCLQRQRLESYLAEILAVVD